MCSKEYFDQVADQWDEMRSGFFSEVVREKAFAAAGVKSGQLAADIGAGSGFITEGLIQKGLKVIAVDQSDSMLGIMQQKFAKHSGIEYRVGSVTRLPIPTAIVDYAFANMVLHHVEEPLVGIQEMVRILKPSGKLVITDLDEHTFEFLRKEHHDYWMGFKREDVQQWFLDAGLLNIIIDCIGEECRSQSTHTNEEASISIFLAIGEKR